MSTQAFRGVVCAANVPIVNHLLCLVRRHSADGDDMRAAARMEMAIRAAQHPQPITFGTARTVKGVGRSTARVIDSLLKELDDTCDEDVVPGMRRITATARLNGSHQKNKKRRSITDVAEGPLWELFKRNEPSVHRTDNRIAVSGKDDHHDDVPPQGPGLLVPRLWMYDDAIAFARRLADIAQRVSKDYTLSLTGPMRRRCPYSRSLAIIAYDASVGREEEVAEALPGFPQRLLRKSEDPTISIALWRVVREAQVIGFVEHAQAEGPASYLLHCSLDPSREELARRRFADGAAAALPVELDTGEVLRSLKLHWSSRDAFFARCAMLTGPPEYAATLVSSALARGYELSSSQGLLKGGSVVPCDSEEDFFHKIGVPYVPPELRRGPSTADIHLALHEFST